MLFRSEATGREEANNEDIAYSMHLALRSGDDAEWQPLNENYGIFFAAGVPIAAATAESRRACTAAARFAADPFDAPRPATDAVMIPHSPLCFFPGQPKRSLCPRLCCDSSNLFQRGNH